MDNYYSYLKDAIPVKEVCSRLGMQVVKKGKESFSLCPFHNDTNPSLTLYKDHYHCFACGAHGDIYSLIKKIRNSNFYESISWLENEFPYVISQKPNLPKKNCTIMDAFIIAFNSYKKMSKEEENLLEEFSNHRNYSKDFLIKREIFFAKKNKLCGQYKNIEEINLLLDKFLIKEELVPNTYNKYVDAFKQDRIIITLRDYNNHIIGFAGRANDDSKPKYLFTKHLPKGDFLYRLNEVKFKCLKSSNKDKKLDLYIVEGVFDALRLEYYGLFSVAVLGSHITQAQVRKLEEFINDISEYYNTVNIYLFLDTDDAGMIGALKSIKNLWLNVTTRKSYISIILNKNLLKTREDNGKIEKFKDPDEILNHNNQTDSLQWIESNHVKVFEFLMRYLYNSDNLVFDNEKFESFYIYNLNTDQRIALLGRVIGIISDKIWIEIFERYSAFEFDCFEYNVCKSYLLGVAQDKIGINPNADMKFYKATFQTAVEIAKNSYIREEVPIDAFTWEMISSCADAFFDYFYNLLKKKEHIKIPMLSIKIPKKHDEYRLKTLYSHEQLIMQQYVLNELLKEDTYRKYELCIPAVRYNPNRERQIYTTGLNFYDFYDNSDNNAVSFAYQINMPVVNGDFSANEGMFRTFYDCWKSFISFIQDGIDKISSNTIYKVKLDIKKYYDNITNYSVRDTLMPMIIEALGTVKNRFQFFNDDSTVSIEDRKEDKAKFIVEWIIEELFGYKYYSSKDGEEKSSESIFIGIPQGPNLSAYVANVILFKLDKSVAEYVDKVNTLHIEQSDNKAEIVVRYARYVDDMVIVSASPLHLNEIKSIIEKELSKLELELSPKTDDSEKTTKEDAYEWLVSERGGLGVTSLFDFAEESTEKILEEYEDYEALDRRNALKLLYNMSIDFNYIDDAEKNNIISSFFKTEDIRYNDIVRFSEMLIRYIIRTDDCESIINSYDQEWEKGSINSLQDSMFRRQGISFLAFIQACINILKSKENNTMSIYEIEQRKNDKLQIVNMLININIIQIYRDRIKSSSVLQENEEILKTMLLQLINLAYSQSMSNELKDIIQNYVESLEIKNEFIEHWLYFTYYNIGVYKKLPPNIKNPGQNKTLYYFHYCISNMILINEKSAYDTIKSIVSSNLERDLLSYNDNFAKCMLIWFCNNVGNIDDSEIALSIIVNVVPSKILPEIIYENGILQECLFENENKKDTLLFLPVPPGVDYPGIFAVTDIADNRMINRADFDREANVVGDLKWEDKSNKNCSYRIETTKINGKWEDLQSFIMNAINTDDYIPRIVRIYEQLYNFIKSYDIEKLILSKYHVFANDNEIIALAYKMGDKKLNSSVAISQGRNSLIVKQVAENGNEYWKAGFILRDILGINKNIILNDGSLQDLTNQMLRYSFDRLTGDAINKKYINKSNKSYESSINRTLTLLKLFNEEKANKKMFILDCMMINNYINYDINHNSNNSFIGEVDYRIGIWAREYLNKNFKTIYDIFVQECNEVKQSISPVRRAALAYYSIGKKLSILSEKYCNMEGFKLLTGGIFSNSVLINIRMQVLERLSYLEENERLNFQDRDFPFELLEIDEDKTVILTDCKNQANNLKSITENLLNGKYDARIKNITHIGWLLLLVWLLEIDSLPNYITIERNNRQIDEKLKSELLNLKNYFLSKDNAEETSDNVNNFPFDGLQSFMKTWTKENTENMFNILDKIDKFDGIKVEIISSEFFKYSISRSTVSLQLDGKILNKQPKQFFTYGKLDSLNISQEKDIKNKDNVIWTQTIKNDKIIGISAIEDMLSNIAIKNNNKEDIILEDKESKNMGEITKESVAPLSTDKEGEIYSEDSSIQDNDQSESADITSDLKSESCCSAIKHFTDEEFKNRINTIREYQSDNWKRRLKHFKNVDRIAFFQFDVDDSYQHPEVEVCKSIKEAVKEEGKQNSCAEFRRQKLLASVMDACAKFSVEILLLPEYSVRPETVEYIYNHIKEQDYKFSVWAGTFRIVPNYSFEGTIFKDKDLCCESKHWSAVLPVINNNVNDAFIKYKDIDDFNELEVITSRYKKYPAISLQELINPKSAKNDMFKPVMKTGKYGNVIFGDARDDVTELICAEMFVMTSPSNINSFAKASFDLYNRLNSKIEIFNNYNDSVINDIKDFGESTAIYQTESKYGRTPIVLVPAYTTRATDYYVTGQAGYLASGLTTVFCNAVAKDNSAIGGSCFIGTDSWDDFNQKDNKYMPNFSPYHGITPGIYQQFLKDKDRGGLGKKEQALLICDINPSVSFKGKPNPESLGKSLELVAHLPIIELSSHIKRQDAKDNSSSIKACRCQKAEERKILYCECLDCFNSNICFKCDNVMLSLIKICEHIISGKKDFGYHTTVQDNKANVIKEAFDILGKNIGSDWLKRRGDKYEEQHINDPQTWPAPTLIDWILVEIDYEEYRKSLTKIDVPKF